MTDAAPVEVVTIVRGREAHLRNLVRGLVASAVRPAALGVVVMGGDDPTLGLPPTPFPIRRRWCDPGGGPLPLARARNLAVAAVRSPAAILLDVDCIPGRDLVGRYAATLAARDVVAMGQVRYLRPGAAAGAWTEADLVARSAPHPARPVPPRPGPTDDHARFWSLSFAVRVATFARLGGFDEGYVGYGGEDTDLGATIDRRGVPLWWQPDALAFHQHHPTTDPPIDHLADIVRNARRFRDKWGRWPMEGWLERFAAAGLVRWEPAGTVLELTAEGRAVTER